MAAAVGFALAERPVAHHYPSLDLCPVKLSVSALVRSEADLRDRRLTMVVTVSILCRRDGAHVLHLDGVGALIGSLSLHAQQCMSAVMLMISNFL